MPQTTPREDHARSILEGWSHNDWDGSATVDELAWSRYAVVVKRDSDSYVLTAQTAQDVADIALGTLIYTSGYDEWITYVFDVKTREEVPFTLQATASVTIEGITAESRS